MTRIFCNVVTTLDIFKLSPDENVLDRKGQNLDSEPDNAADEEHPHGNLQCLDEVCEARLVVFCWSRLLGRTLHIRPFGRFNKLLRVLDELENRFHQRVLSRHLARCFLI